MNRTGSIFFISGTGCDNDFPARQILLLFKELFQFFYDFSGSSIRPLPTKWLANSPSPGSMI